MNVVGFLFVAMFGILSIWISRAMAKDDRMAGFRHCPTAVGTICGTQKVYNRNRATSLYRYKVEFRDQDGKEALGLSDSFHRKRTLQNDEIVTFYYRPVKQGKYDAELKAITNAVFQAIFGRTPAEDPRPRYDIRFCDQKMYERENAQRKKSATAIFIAGCVFLILAVVVLIFGYR